jgi:kumamolisin
MESSTIAEEILERRSINIPAGYQRLEKSERHIAPNARCVGPADPNETLSVTVCVRRRPDGPPMPDLNYWIKTPPGQRQFLSNEEFATRYGAAQADLDAVTKFARGHGMKIGQTSVAGRTVVLSGTVAQMSKAFAAELGRYETPTAKYRGREGFIYVPADMAKIVVGVFGLDNRPVGGHDFGDPPNTGVLTPHKVAILYNFPDGDGAGQTIGIFAAGGGYKPDDFKKYIQDFTGNPPNTLPVPVGADNRGGTNEADDREILQDICIAGLIAPSATIAIYFAKPDPMQPGATGQNWIDTINRMVHPKQGDPIPTVISISAHLVSGDDFDTIMSEGMTSANINMLHNFFQDAMIKNIAVLAASGDKGSSRDRPDLKAHVHYPASDPFVTGCGGTTIGNLNPNGSSFDEIVWNDDGGASGGGVSEYFDLPAYQSGANVPLSKNAGNRKGRGVPDVAGNASVNSGYQMQLTTFSTGTKFFNAGGTSAVAPLYAGLLARINNRLVQNAGFLNPNLYTYGQGSGVFRDITDGDNQLKDNPGAPSYSAGPGWDACTGWGSINGWGLLRVLKRGQDNWRWCYKCQGMFWDGRLAPWVTLPPPPVHLPATPEPHVTFPPPPLGDPCLGGACPADHRAHDATQSGYYAAAVGEEGRGQQGGWRWCRKCSGMFFALNPSKGVCPSDGQAHDDSQSPHYAAVRGDGDDPVQQGGWRWCHKCQGMFFALPPSQGSQGGVCPADGQAHDGGQSGAYGMLWGEAQGPASSCGIRG